MVECVVKKDLNANLDDVEAVMTESAKLAGVTLTGGTDFVLNNHTITSASLTGADIDFDAETNSANITVPTAVQNVTVVSGALQASITGNTLYLQNADKTPKQSANLTLSPSSVSLNAYQHATVTATHLGDGLVKCYNNQFIKVEQINATDFKLIPQFAGTGQMGFWLDETATYYGAAGNVSITAEAVPPVILMHFDDASQPFLNAGSAAIGEATNNATIGSEYGHFGSGIYATHPTNVGTAFTLGGKDFTIDFWAKSYVNFAVIIPQVGNLIGFKTNDKKQVYLYYTGGQLVAVSDLTLYNSVMRHIAYCYNHDEKKGYLFVDGSKQYEVDKEIEQVEIATLLFSYQGGESIMDELRILDGVCAWTSEFTPPESPYSA